MGQFCTKITINQKNKKRALAKTAHLRYNVLF